MFCKVGYVSLEIIGLERNNALYYTIKENPKEQIRRATIFLSISVKFSISMSELVVVSIGEVWEESALTPRPQEVRKYGLRRDREAECYIVAQ